MTINETCEAYFALEILLFAQSTFFWHLSSHSTSYDFMRADSTPKIGKSYPCLTTERLATDKAAGITQYCDKGERRPPCVG